MKTEYKRVPTFQIPGYNQNAALKLIVASGSGFILYYLVRVTLIVYGHTLAEAESILRPMVALSPVSDFLKHAWTILTYGWVYNGLMEWISTMVWLYCFGSALQMLINYRQVIAIFFYGLIGGGVVCLLGQLIPGGFFPEIFPLTGQAGVMALMAALLTLSPRYRFFLSDNMSMPMWIIALVYTAITFAFMSNHSVWMLNIGGLLAGFVGMKMLQSGIQPGGTVYAIFDKLEAATTAENDIPRVRKPNIIRKDNSQQQVDDILDKINQKGYKSLTNEEREILMRASKTEK